MGAQANGPKPWTPGFGADISILAGYTDSTSQFNTDNHTISTLDDEAPSQSNAFFAPLGTVSYTNQDLNQQIYFGTSRSDLALGRFHVELGYRYRIEDNGMITLSYVPGILKTDTWKDPFVINEKREETESKIRGLRFQYDRILGSNFSFEISGGEQVVDDEQSGANSFPEFEDQLQREGDIIFTELSYVQPISRSQLLRGGINYTRLNADGDAMASDAFGAELGLIQMMRSSSLALTLSYTRTDFDAVNPVFGTKQQDDKWGVFLAYEYKEPFDWENWGIVSLAGYSQSESNISFYDEDSLLVSLGINYRF
ncbi:DUF2860 domain-containing protein [Photobacterium sanctipauli]|uniref:DUF2860 domain-containing protein n=2 Tax=Photobacterium sanctipauli TaxID=1342794 RepID=A0A2T3NZ55_9GAMM|nr:DUF2860 domain-containing protein [Photobacterium sanctipauli]